MPPETAGKRPYGYALMADRALPDTSCPHEPRAGIEPTTFPLRVGRSGRLSYRGLIAAVSACAQNRGWDLSRKRSAAMLGYLDSDQDNKVQNLAGCQLPNTPWHAARSTQDRSGLRSPLLLRAPPGRTIRYLIPRPAPAPGTGAARPGLLGARRRRLWARRDSRPHVLADTGF